MTIVSMNYLLEAGVQFGHQKRRWNPKMREYIFTTRDDIYIIDLQKTVKKLEEAYEALKEIVANEGKVLFVGTKKQAQEAAEECALRTNMFYVNERWLGGTLTNFKTIRSRIRRMEEIENMEKDGTFEALPKKEVIQIKKEYDKLVKNLRGIREMKRMPQAMVIVDPRKEEIAIKEAHILGIPVFGIVDTNSDPDLVDYVIPGNDDAVRSVKLLIGAIVLIATHWDEVCSTLKNSWDALLSSLKSAADQIARCKDAYCLCNAWAIVIAWSLETPADINTGNCIIRSLDNAVMEFFPPLNDLTALTDFVTGLYTSFRKLLTPLENLPRFT